MPRAKSNTYLKMNIKKKEEIKKRKRRLNKRIGNENGKR